LRIHIEYGEWKGKIAIPSVFGEVVKEIGLQEKRRLGEICFIFVSEKEIIRVNREFLKHDYATDVITFGNNRKFSIGGDIYISPEVVFVNAGTYISDNYSELFRVMIHGILHLAGYTDASVEEKRIMRNREDYYLDWGRNAKILN
jgi:probable rRNA maturation factor